MFKAILIGLVLAFLSCGLLCGGCLYLSMRVGTKHQERFFTAIASGDPAQVEALLTPALRAQIDEPLLAAWIETINQQLGPFQRLSSGDFATSSHVGTDGTRTETKGTVEFAHGTAKSRLVFVNDLVEEFKVTSPQIPDDWWTAAAGSDFYQRLGEKFLSALLNGETQKAFSMVAPALQEVSPRDRMAEVAHKLVEKEGPPQRIEYATRRIDVKAAQPLRIFYTLRSERGQAIASVTFVFKNLRGQIIDFKLAVAPAEMNDVELVPHSAGEPGP